MTELERYHDSTPQVFTPAPARTDTDSWIQVVNDVAMLASKIAGTEFVPKGLRGNPAGTAAAILYGREVGLPPMTALSQTHVVEGRPAISAEGMRAMILAAGHQIVVTETSGAICTMRGSRRGTDDWTTVSWTIDMARAAGLTGKSNWKSYPRQMLQARATAELARLVFPDVIHGFKAVEEFDELEGSGEPPARRRTAKVQRTVTEIQPPAAPAADLPPLPGDEPPPPAATTDGDDVPPVVAPAGEEDQPPLPESGSSPAPSDEPVDGDVVEEPAEPQEKDPAEGKPSTKAQHRLIFGALKPLDVDEEERHDLVSRILGRPVESFNNLTRREAGTVIDTLALCQSRADLDAALDAADLHHGQAHS